MKNRASFASGLGAVLSMVGVAVGLGNVWRFPYMMGANGGSAFLLIYLGFTLLFGIPALMAELAVGRHTQKGPLGTFSSLLNKPWGQAVGYLLLITPFVAASYYLVVVGNVAFTAAYSLLKGFGSAAATAEYQRMLALTGLQYGIALALMVGNLVAIALGLRKGIEGLSKLLVPLFMATVLFLIVYTLTLPGTRPALAGFLTFNLADVTPKVLLAGLGQAVFSLGLGGTFMLLYGSYMPKGQSITRTALATGMGDLSAALLSGLFIVPAVLVYGLDMTGGPTLLFNTLPQLFGAMPGGRFIGSLFLLCLTGVAFLSSLAALEVFANALKEHPRLTIPKRRLLLGIGVVQAALMLPPALDPALIGVLDMVFGTGLQIVGTGVAVLTLGYVLRKPVVLAQLFTTQQARWAQVYYFWIRVVLPAILGLLLVTYLYQTFSA